MPRKRQGTSQLLDASRPPEGLKGSALKVYLDLYTDLSQRRFGQPVPKSALDKEHCRVLAITAYRVSTLADDDTYRVALLDATSDMPLERQHRLSKLMHDTGRTLQLYHNHIIAIDASFDSLRGPDPAGEDGGTLDLDAERRKRRGRG